MSPPHRPPAADLRGPGWLHVCVDRPLAADRQAAADDVAVELRPDNVGVAPRDPDRVGGLQRLAVEKRHRWPIGHRLRVRFLDGDAAVHEAVAALAGEWTRHGDIAFDFVDGGEAEVRITFRSPGATWSYVGTEAAVIPPAEPTMNLGRLTRETPDPEVRQTVLHALGHALGAVHEHGAPGPAIPWDGVALHAYCARALGWSGEEVEANVVRRYRGDHSNAAVVDTGSIMRFAIPAELTAGAYSVPWNSSLSERDQLLVAVAYPHASTVTELALGHRYPATVTCAGVTDVYHFTVPAAGSYLMATHGPADATVALWGPDDAGALRAFDDSSGRGRGARILRRLRSGRYVLTVQHGAARAGEPYEVGVHRVR